MDEKQCDHTLSTRTPFGYTTFVCVCIGILYLLLEQTSTNVNALCTQMDVRDFVRFYKVNETLQDDILTDENQFQSPFY